jgi:uncharacterized membrane protein
MTHSLHVKGFDSFTTSTYMEGGSALIAALRSGGVNVTYQPCHLASNAFPDSPESLSAFDVIVLSDIGANTLLLRDSTFVRSEIWCTGSPEQRTNDLRKQCLSRAGRKS